VRRAGRSGLVGQPGSWAARAFFQRIKARRGFQTAVVTTARKTDRPRMASDDQRSGLRVRPTQPGTHKRRKLELAARAPSRRGNYHIPGAAYNDKQGRNEEKELAEQPGIVGSSPTGGA
jgi:transposase